METRGVKDMKQGKDKYKKLLIVLSVIVIIITTCTMVYVFNDDNLFKKTEEKYKVAAVLDMEGGFNSFLMLVAEGVYSLKDVEGMDTLRVIDKSSTVAYDTMKMLINNRENQAGHPNLFEYEDESNIYHYPNKIMFTGADLIVSSNGNVYEGLWSIIKTATTQDFLLVDVSIPPGEIPKNVANIIFRMEEPSYVAGYVAGMTTETNVVGFIGAFDNSIINSFKSGFVKGVKRAESERGVPIKVVSEYINTYSDMEVGMEVATDMYINKNVDIIYQAAGSAGIGVIDAAVFTDNYVIGVDTDQNYFAPKNVIFSVVKMIPKAVHDAAIEYKNGNNLGGREISLGYGEGDYVGVVNYLENVISPEVIEKAKDLEMRIAHGNVIV